jgi:calcineurin-like phosphoesterase family protein
MSKFLVADLHLGEDRWDLMGRPFTDVQEHVDVMVRNHNSIVSPDDVVYVVGDALYQKADPEVFLPQIARFNGRKILCRGNHDRPFTDAQFSPYFDEIHAEGEGIAVNLGGLECWIQHYPSLASADVFNIVGHVHGAWKFQLNSLNVGVDANHFYPTPEAKIPFFLKAITEFYDNDVWAAYAYANQAYIANRGKKSNYFTPEPTKC